MNLSSIIGKKKEYAEYMIKEITHICKTMGKRDPGSEGEKKACEYMADVLKNDCGCDRVTVESFEEHPGSFYGWITIDIILALISIVLLALGLGKTKKDADEDEDGAQTAYATTDEEEDETEIKRHRMRRLLSLIPDLGAILLFVFTQDLTQSMVIFDKWSLAFFGIVLVQALIAFLSRKKEKDPDDDGDDRQDQGQGA